MDVIVTYQNESGDMKTVWIPYQEGEIQTGGQKMEIVPDLINPGIFDPGEKMKLQIWLDPSDPIENSSENWLLVAAPNGIKASRYFSRIIFQWIIFQWIIPESRKILISK